MKLRTKQSMFCRSVGELIEYAYDRGFELTFGHALRCKDCTTGHVKSLHKIKLAIDFDLFIDGVYQTETEAYRELGEFWESLGGAWGGRFNDGRHFSFEHEGMK